MHRATLPALLALLLLVSGGCRISRDRVNPHVRDIDTSWIVPGETTRRAVIDRIGFPPATGGHGGGVTADAFRWTIKDTRTVTLEAGYVVTPTFELSRSGSAEDILVTFDGEGTVTLVSRTVSDGRNTRIVEWRESRR